MGEDLTWAGVTTVCVCGGREFKLLATFDECYEVASYNAWMFCEGCGSKLEAPMPGVNC